MKKSYFVIFCLFFLFGSLRSQEFGKNKIQYRNFDWQYTKTPHFIIYYYTGEEELVKFATQVAEDSYNEISDDMNHSFKERMPLIIYNSHNDFEQTNVTLSLIEESVGGFTEIFKNRMVLPFEGSYESFRHVINHELVHAFQFNILFGSNISNIIQAELMISIPLWVMEGLAEFESLNWDSGTESYIRDAVINNRLLSIQTLNYYYGYASYKEGQSIYKFIAETYGRKKIGELFHTLRQKKDFEKALKSVLGLTSEQLNEKWSKSLKKKYWPLYDKKDELNQIARKLTDHKKEGNAYNISPSISPGGDRIAFITDKEDYFEVIIISSINGKILKKLVKATKSATFESLHILRPNISWSYDSGKITFTAKAGKEDVIYIIDAENEDIVSVLKPKCDAVYSPSFSPDGKSIVFNGVKACRSDIYIIDITTQKLERLTNDVYDDREPVFSPDGETIVFSSDREDASDSLWHYGNYALFRMTSTGKGIEQLTERETKIGSPVFSKDGKKIIFVSDRDGVNNLYILEIENSSIHRLTDVFGGISSPSLSSDNKKLAFSGYEEGGYDVYMVSEPLVYPEEETGKSINFDTRHTVVKKDCKLEKGKKAGLNFSTDWAGGYLGFSNSFGFQSMMQISISDILGDNRFDLAFDLYSSNLLDANFQLVYWYLPKRWDIGAALFQQKNFYLVFPLSTEENIEIIEETLRGLSLLFRFPIDKFHRFDLETDIFTMHQSYELYNEYGSLLGEGETETYYNLLPTLSWIRDTAIWGYTGPINGERWKFSYAKSIPKIATYSFDYSILYGDIRNYLRIVKDYSLATRVYGFGSWGKDALYYPLGGSENVRGYDYYSFYGKKAGFINLELRYPFIEKFKTHFPLPLNITGVRGVAFCDIGGVTDQIRNFKTSIRTDRGIKLDDLKLGFGTGMRMNINIAVLKFDIAWHSNLESISRMYIHFSLGSEF